MHDEFLVGIADRLTHLLKQAQPLDDTFVAAVLVDWRAFHVFHHHVRLAYGGCAGVEQLRHIGMSEAGQDLAFEFEARDHGAVQQPGADHLDGDLLLVKIVIAGGQVDAAHSALTELADDSIGADSLRGFGFGQRGLTDNAADGIRCVAGLQHGLDFKALLRLARTCFIEETGTPLG